jgi:hypothetical protein
MLDLNEDSIDLILDLGAPNFVPVSGFTKLVASLLRKLVRLYSWRTITVIGTSFPMTMAEISGTAQLVKRQEWLLYELLVDELRQTRTPFPSFGDYTICHPEVLQVDMRIVKPFASIRYTTNKAWFILKGTNVRDNGYGQFRDLCKKLIESPYYRGKNFSESDRYIWDCAHGIASTGNLTTWRWVGTNHHIESVVLEIANFFGSSSVV